MHGHDTLDHLAHRFQDDGIEEFQWDRYLYLQGTGLSVDVPLSESIDHHGDTVQHTQQKCQLQGYLEKLGEGAIQI